MQSIAILAPSPVPFQLGGAEKSFNALHRALSALPGFLAEMIKLPCREDDFPGLLDAYERFSKLDLSHFDRVITCKYPAWITPHHCHIVYMYHPLRGVYDLYPFPLHGNVLKELPAPLQDLADLLGKSEPGRDDLGDLFALCRRALKHKALPSSLFRLPGPLVREIVRFLDRIALAPGQIKRYFALSRTVAGRENYFPANAPVEILHLPSPLENLVDNATDGESGYFFTASRVNAVKRIDMIISAMAWVRGDVQLKIAGTGPELDNLRCRAADDGRIEFLGHVPDEMLARLYAHALAVPFVPFNEDYGLITVEAMRNGKPVITTSDAGGVCELVRDGHNGLITAPDAAALGKAMNRLALDRDLARTLGANGRRSVERLRWDNVAAALAGPFGPTVVVAAPFGADAEGAGGPRRLWHFCRQLSQYFQVRLIALGPPEQKSVLSSSPSPHWSQLLLPWPPEAAAEASAFALARGISGDDLVVCRHAAGAENLLAALAEAGAGAAGVICAHPWLYDAVTASLPHLPVIYDAYNVEADLKSAILGRDLAAPLADMEKRLCQVACHVFACAGGDMERLIALYGVPEGNVSLLPNGCDMPDTLENREELRRRLPFPEARLAIFLGSNHKPNVDGVLALAKIAPLVPEAHFLIAGSVCDAWPLSSARLPSNLHLLGRVSERVKNLLLAAADLALNPVTAGSGTNLKTVEYMASALPIVSTPCGVRGIAATMGDMMRICDLESFPAAMRHVLSNPPEPARLAASARAVRLKWSWSAVMADLCPTLQARLSHAVDN